MEFVPRKLLLKRETGLLMRLNNIDCIKGELFKKDRVLLQFTGLYDKQNEEIYEMDMLLIGGGSLSSVGTLFKTGGAYPPFPIAVCGSRSRNRTPMGPSASAIILSP